MKGGILFIRIGTTKEWDNDVSTEQKQAYAARPDAQYPRVEATQGVLR
jgi:hypothetical protein